MPPHRRARSDDGWRRYAAGADQHEQATEKHEGDDDEGDEHRHDRDRHERLPGWPERRGATGDNRTQFTRKGETGIAQPRPEQFGEIGGAKCVRNSLTSAQRP